MMRSKCLAAMAAAMAVLALTSAEPAMADGTASAEPAKARSTHARHGAYRYVRGPWPGGPDPYAYGYQRVSYYPFYESTLWVPRHQMIGRSKYPLRLPEYYSSWGYPLTCKVQQRRNCGVPFVSETARDPHH